MNWRDKIQTIITKVGENQFVNNASKRPFSQALIPSKRQLGLGEILATGGTGNIRDISSEYWFGPLQPITPVAPSSYRPRQFPFVPGANILWQPKSDSPITFDTLRALADSWDLLRIVIEQQKDRICKTKFTARRKMDQTKMRTDWEEENAKDPIVKLLNEEFLSSPDGFHDFRTWLRMWLEDMIVCDAVALWMERDMKGKIASVHPIAGDTINRLLTDQGITPPPPSPAYQQVVYGTPACDLTSDDLIYFMRNERASRRYGFSPVEQILITISIGLRRQEFQLQYYTSGNVPEALCFLPGDVSADKVKEYQEFFDAMLAGDLSKRRRLTFLPGFGGDGKAQSTVQFTKETLLKDDMDEWLAKIVCMCIGISPQPFMKMMNRAQAQQQQETSEEEGKEPYIASVVDVLNNLIQRKMGLKDYEVIREEDTDLDVVKQAQADNLVVGKIIKINEIRKRRGLDADDSPEADMLGTFTPTGFVPLSAEDQLDRQETMGTDPESTHARTIEANQSKPAPVVAEGEGGDGTDGDGGPPSKNGNGKSKTNGNGKAKNKDAKGKPDGATKLHKAATFRHGSLHHIKAGVLTHTSQEAKTAFEHLLTRKFHAMRNVVVQHVHAAVNKTLSSGELAKMDVATLDEFKRATQGKTRYSVNHIFDKTIQIRPGGKRPYGKRSEIYDTELNIADLTPTQYWLKPEVVVEYAEDGKNDSTSQERDKPVHVVRSGNSWLLSDGHHRCAADRLQGKTTVQATVFPRWASNAEIERNKAKKATVAAKYMEGGLAKIDDYSDIVDEIMQALQEDFTTLSADAEAFLQQAALSGLTQGVIAIDVSDTSLLSDVNTTAKEWATDRAAEMVGMSYDDAGNLVDNPDAQWAITDTTRNKIQEIVTDAFAEPSTMADIAARIDSSGVFDAARAESIARTEISRAQMMGNFEFWTQSGAVTQYDWLLSEDNPCDECQEISDGGPYVMGEGPLPIDDSHPNCECVIVAVMDADSEE